MSTVHVSPSGVSVAEPAGDEPPAPPAPLSTLALLRAKRGELERQMHKDYAIPRWDAVLGRTLWVRYRPGDPALFAAATEKRERAHRADIAKGGRGDPDRMYKANADVLVAACVAVYDLAIGEQPPAELDGDLPTFSSPELSEALGAPKTAVETCRKLYGTDGDLLVAATQLMEWSGQASREASDAFLGD